MHDDAELGMAANIKRAIQAVCLPMKKIAWLRKLLAWQDDITVREVLAELRNECLMTVYMCFTPKGEVVDCQQDLHH